MPICSPFVDNNSGKVLAVTSATRPTGANLYEGRVIYETDTDRLLMYEGTAWIILDEPWQAFTPTWTNLTIGNAVQSFFYRRADGYVDISGQILFGTTTTVGGLVGLGVPAAITAAAVGSSLVTAWARIDDASAVTAYPAWITFGTTTRLDFYTFNAAAAAAATATPTAAASPMAAWAVNDAIYVGARWRMATRTS
jgi:hypothetical protein